MSYTLAGAATATGQSKKAILRAIRDGKIAGTKDALGNWSIEAAALFGRRGGGAGRADRGAAQAGRREAAAAARRGAPRPRHRARAGPGTRRSARSACLGRLR